MRRPRGRNIMHVEDNDGNHPPLARRLFHLEDAPLPEPVEDEHHQALIQRLIMSQSDDSDADDDEDVDIDVIVPVDASDHDDSSDDMDDMDDLDEIEYLGEEDPGEIHANPSSYLAITLRMDEVRCIQRDSYFALALLCSSLLIYFSISLYPTPYSLLTLSFSPCRSRRSLTTTAVHASTTWRDRFWHPWRCQRYPTTWQNARNCVRTSQRSKRFVRLWPWYVCPCNTAIVPLCWINCAATASLIRAH